MTAVDVRERGADDHLRAGGERADTIRVASRVSGS